MKPAAVERWYGRYDELVTRPRSPSECQSALREQAYLADRGLSTSIFLALSLGRPLLLEGEAGVGKTEVAKTLAAAFGVELIRLQCYEGIDAGQALYEWDYARQLLHIRTLSERAAADKQTVQELFSPQFLVERPLLKALRAGEGAVLLVDEVDRADDEFEAFLLEVLSDFQVTVPEIGTIRAETPPVVLVTSNRTRELHDALKRRCLYHWIDYPTPEREVEIVRVRAPEVSAALAMQVSRAVSRLRRLNLAKPPGVAETIDWAHALTVLGARALDVEIARDTLGSVVKDHDDLALVHERLAEVVGDG
jgi:MoxR-like ATPase